MGKFEIISEALFYGSCARNDKGEIDLNHPDGPIGDPPVIAVLSCTRANWNCFAPLYATNSIYADRFLKVLLLSPTFGFTHKYSVMGDGITDALLKQGADRIDFLTSLSLSSCRNVSADAFVEIVLSKRMYAARFFRVWFDFKGDTTAEIEKHTDFAGALTRVVASPIANEKIRRCALITITRFLYDPRETSTYSNEAARARVIENGILPAIWGILSKSALHYLHVDALALLQRLLRKNKNVTAEMLQPLLVHLTMFVLIHPAAEMRREGTWVCDAIFDGKPAVWIYDNPSIKALVTFLVRHANEYLGEIQYLYAEEDAAELAELKKKNAGQAEKQGREGDDGDDDAGLGSARVAGRKNAAGLILGLIRTLSRVMGAAVRGKHRDLMNHLCIDSNFFGCLAEIMHLLPSTSHHKCLDELQVEWKMEMEMAKEKHEKRLANKAQEAAAAAAVTTTDAAASSSTAATDTAATTAATAAAALATPTAPGHNRRLVLGRDGCCDGEGAGIVLRSNGDLPLIRPGGVGQNGPRSDVYVCMFLAISCSHDFLDPMVDNGIFDALREDCAIFKEQNPVVARAYKIAAGALEQEAPVARPGGKKLYEIDDEGNVFWPVSQWTGVISLFDDITETCIDHCVNKSQSSGETAADMRHSIGNFVMGKEKLHRLFSTVFIDCAMQYVVAALLIRENRRGDWQKVQKQLEAERAAKRDLRRKAEQLLKSLEAETNDAAGNGPRDEENNDGASNSTLSRNSDSDSSSSDNDDHVEEDFGGSTAVDDDENWSNYSIQRATRMITGFLTMESLATKAVKIGALQYPHLSFDGTMDKYAAELTTRMSRMPKKLASLLMLDKLQHELLQTKLGRLALKAEVGAAADTNMMPRLSTGSE